MEKLEKPKLKLHTRHREYSLAVAVAVAILLMFFQDGSASVAMASGMMALGIASTLYSAFSVVRHADVLAHRFGEPWGSIILSVAIVVLEASLICVMMLSGAAGETMLRDTLYAVIIIVMGGFVGVTLLLGGLRYKNQSFNFTGVKHFLISIIPLAFIVLALPTVLPTAEGDGRLEMWQLIVMALCCVLVYVFFLRIQTVTHMHFFIYEDEDDDGDHHGKASCYSNLWHFAWLAVHLVAVIGVTKLNSVPLGQVMVALNAPPALTGFLVAALILSPEATGAMRSVMRDQPQRSMNLLLGSVLASITLTVPAVVIVAAITGQRLLLGLSPADIVIMVAALMISQTSLTGGRTNAHSGAAHLVIFIAYIMLLFS